MVPTTPAEIARRALADHLAALPPAELLVRYAQRRDPEAFAGLVQQFGPMVLAVCRRVLGASPDADDAFQATFLTLARQAPALRDSGALPAWLHRVAVRTARKGLARRAAERAERADAVDIADPTDALENAAWKDVRRVLDEELDALPARVRGAVVLCWLDGLTQDEAAAKLGFSLNTLKRRLTAGRELLRARLTRRGLAPVLVAAAVLDPTGLRALVPQPLALLAVEGGVGAPVPPAVEALAVFVSATVPARGYVKVAAALVLVAGVATAGVVAVNRARPPAPADPLEQAKADPDPIRFDVFGDPLPPRALLRIGTDRFRVPGSATVSTVSPDGKRLAVIDSAMWSRTQVRVLDLTAGRTLWSAPVENPTPNPAVLEFTADGKRLLVVEGGAVRVHDTESGHLATRFVRQPPPADRAGYYGAWAPSGSPHLFVAAGEPGDRDTVSELVTIDPATGAPVRTVRTPGVVVAVAPDAKHFYALAGQRTLWRGNDVPQGDTVYQFDAGGKEVRRFSIRAGGVCTATLSPDGARLALNSYQGELRVFDTATGAELARRGQLNVIWGAMTGTVPQVEEPLFGFECFTADGAGLLGSDLTGVWGFDIASRTARYRFAWPNVNGPGEAPALPGRPRLEPLQPHAKPQRGVGGWVKPSHSVGNVMVRVAREGDIERWDLTTGTQLPRPTGFDKLLATRSADGRLIAAADARSGRCEILDGHTGKSLRTFRLTKETYRVSLSRDGTTLVATAASPLLFHGVTLWDTTTGRARPLPAPLAVHMSAGNTRDFAFAPDGSIAALADRDEEPPLEVIVDEAPPKVPKPKPKLVPAALRVFDATTGKLLWDRATDRPKPARASQPVSVTFSVEGDTLACVWSNDVIAFYEARTGKELSRFDATPGTDPGEIDPKARGVPGFGTYIRSVQFAPGGTTVGWYDDWRNRIRVLGLRGAQEPVELHPRKPGTRGGTFSTLSDSFSFGPGGVWLAAVDGTEVKLWDVATGTLLETFAGHRGAVTGVEFARDGRTLLSVSADRTALVWEVKPRGGGAGRTPEQLWADLAGDPTAAFRAVWEAAAHPGSPQAFRAALPPAAAPDGPLSADHWRQKRAVLALELAGTPAARAVLAEWAGGAAGAVLTDDARAALGRLGGR